MEGVKDSADGAGEGEIEAVTCNPTALVEAIGLQVYDERGEGLDEGGAGGGVEKEKVDESVYIGGIGIGGVHVIGEGSEHGVSGNGGVGIDDIDEVVDEAREPLSIELHAVDGGVAARRGVAILAVPFQLVASVAGDCTSDAAGDVAAEDVVAAKGANGSDFGCVGRVGGGRGGRWIAEWLALAGGGFGGKKAAVGG